MDVVLECRRLNFSHGTTPVLNGISLSLRAGRFTAILGRNGSGKTTLLHCLNGIHSPPGGTVFLHGRDIRTLTRQAVARQISLVVQEQPEVFPFRVLDVVVMGRAPFLGPMATPGPEDYALAMAALETLQVGHLSPCNFNRISGGERQMTLLATALVQTRQIMLLDEPTNHLDFTNQYLLLSRIKTLCETCNTAVVAALHDPNMAMLFAHEVILLQQGRLLDVGPVEQVMTRKKYESTL